MVKKIKHLWRSEPPGRQNEPRVAQILGAPDDRGVLNVGGRLGAGHGPSAIRAMLASFMTGLDGEIGKIVLHKGLDIDIDIGESIVEGHRRFREAIAESIASGVLPIAIGGGHDYGYPHFAGVADALSGRAALVNVDAHLDVRPPGSEGITSGSPFYLALEEGVLKPSNFVELGIQEHCNDQSFGEYLRDKGARVIMLDDARRKDGGPVTVLKNQIESFAKKGLRTVVSFDVDAVQMAHAPGVSAPQIDGFTPGEFLSMARVCGENASVASVGFFEFAPPLDENQRTARLVATAIHRFLSGFSRRVEMSS